MSAPLVVDDADRHRIVRLCALISGSWAHAEDLAQETLLEAFRNAQKLRDVDGRDRWLNAIARNVCRRWARKEAATQARSGEIGDPHDLAADFDITVELEREELAGLLDRALALLPEQTREVLVRRYLDDSPPAEIAAGMALSPDAVSMRINRGKLLLRRVLETDLRDHAEAYGFVRPFDAVWRSTSVWCTQCGRSKLAMSTASGDGSISFQCRTCTADPPVLMSYYAMSNPYWRTVLSTAARPSTIVNRAASWVHEYFLAGIRVGVVRCTRCGASTPLHRYERDDPSYSLGSRRGVYAHCDRCDEEVSCSLGGIALSLPQLRSFRQSRKRIHALPVRTVEHAGRPTVVLGYADASSPHDRVDVLLDDESFDIRALQASAG